ncbi:MAG TPA: dipeptidase [Verrucomicrobia bacterium]|nr:MAG: dipeptidase [Lentisphaerae bacterium GWF2_57_35]HBA85373.1 dipeptidase [Verrucomicrobiota bacterium]
MKKTWMCIGVLLGSSIAGMACTVTLITKGASADGSVLVSHSDDNELGDQRIVYVPAADHPAGSKRPVYYDSVSIGVLTNYGIGMPRYVGTHRGPGYVNAELQQDVPLGYIDQVPHTYAYFDGNYGIVNEHQLSIGECTDGAKVEPNPEPGKRIFYSSELSRVALERCTQAREACRLMGELIDRYGYYGTGETLLIGDTEEGWIFEMAGYDMNGADGLWVAKKVPDGEIFAAANEFRIREIDPGDPDMFFSSNLFAVAQAKGWWKPEDGQLDWLKTVSHGEYNHPYYSLRRVWSIFNRVSPSSKFSPWVEDGYTKAYPFSIKPEKKLSARDVFALHRNHYEGTEFDMTQGLAAGPYGTPNRYIGPYDGNQNNVSAPGQVMWGAWERPISVFYCGFVYVNQSRGWLPDPVGGICWMGLDKPSETCFVPFYVGVNDLPASYQQGSTTVFDRNTAWWAFNFTANWADFKFSYMKVDIQAKQAELEDKEFAMQPAVDLAAAELYKQDPARAREYLTDYCRDNAQRIVGEWWALADRLVAKYSDGYVNAPGQMAHEVGYPKAWLEQVGYANGPIQYRKPEKK